MKDATYLTESDAYRIVIRDLLLLLGHAERHCTCEECLIRRATYSIDPERVYDSFQYQTLLTPKP